MQIQLELAVQAHTQALSQQKKLSHNIIIMSNQKWAKKVTINTGRILEFPGFTNVQGNIMKESLQYRAEFPDEWRKFSPVL